MKTKFKYIIAVTIVLITILIIFLLKTPDKLKGNIAMLKSENISISISDVNTNDNGAIEFLYDSGIKQVTVVADFKDTTSSGKKLEIVLNEGLTYKSYQVFEKQNCLETDFSDGIVKDSIESIERPTYVEDTKFSSLLQGNYTAHGSLIYHIKDDKSRIEITFNVNTNMYNFYGAKFIEDAIKVNLYKENKKIDTINMDVNIAGVYDIKYKNMDSSSHVMRFFSSAENNESYGYTMTKVSTNSKGFMLPFYKKAVYTLYYFDNTTFDSIIFSNRSGKSGGVYEYYEGLSEDKCINVENFNAEKKVVVTIGDDNANNCYNHYLTAGISVKYKVSNYNEFGFSDINDTKLFDRKGNDELSVTYYDNNVVNYVNSVEEKLEVFHPDKNNNLLNIYTETSSYDDYDDNSIILGPFFGVENNTPGEKTNQMFEFEIDSNYEVVGITIPKHKDTQIKEISYKTNKNDWTSYTNINVSTDKKFLLTKEDAGLEDDEFFIGARIILDKFPEIYRSHIGSPKANYNALVYGNLKSSVTSADVKFKICNDNNNCIEKTKTVSRPNSLTCRIRNTGISFNDINSKEIIKTINSGEKFVLTGDLGINGYPYGTTSLMKDVNIYLRQPKGLIIDLDDVKLYDKNKEEIIPKIRSVKRENDILYILETNSVIGYYKDYASFVSKKEDIINISVPYTIEKGSNLSYVDVSDLILYGNENYNGVVQGFPSIIEDINDMDNNPKTSKIPLVTVKTLTIQPDKSFFIQTFIKKDNIQYPQYNENNKDTIIEISKDESIEYNVKIKNNMAEEIDNYSIYIPIPKKGANYGTNYQSDIFEWDFNLLEELNEIEKFEILYSDDILYNSMVDPSKMNYKENISDLNNVTMIKIVSKEAINPLEEYIFTIKLKVSDEITNKENSKLNIWNPVSYVESNVVTGIVKGSGVATRLYAPSIAGIIYLDINKNKVYDENIDIPGVNDVKLELYRKEETKEVKVKDINIDILSGEFNYFGDKSLKDGIYYLKLNSSLYQTNSEVVKDGWIKELTFENGEGYYYEVGYITDEFAPSIIVEDAYIYVGDKIEFEKYIIEAYDYKKEKIEFIFGKNTTYSSDITNEKGIATKAGTYYATYEVTDKYGNKGSSLIKIYVKEKVTTTASTSKKEVIVSPSTLDDITKYIIMGMLSLVGVVISIILYKKIKANK